MYAPFEGVAFLEAHAADRAARLAELGARQAADDGAFDVVRLTRLALARGESATLALAQLDPAQTIQTAALLGALLRALGTSGEGPAAHAWLARLVQRFEITKKIFERYEPGFRRGQGTAGCITLYLDAALCLSVAYGENGHLQYLSTLMKLNDLLLSVPADMYDVAVDRAVLGMVAATEANAIAKLAQRQGVAFNGR